MDGVIHLVAALAIVLGSAWNAWLAVPGFVLLGFFWERNQHRDESFFGWITGHRAWEAAAWGVGALVAAAAIQLWKLFGH